MYVCVCVCLGEIFKGAYHHILSLSSHRPQLSSTFPSLSHCAVIATNWSGVTEFTTEDNSYLVQVKVRPLPLLSNNLVILFYFIYFIFSEVWVGRGEREWRAHVGAAIGRWHSGERRKRGRKLDGEMDEREGRKEKNRTEGLFLTSPFQKQMRHIYCHREEARERGLRARDDVVTLFHPRNISKILLNEILRVSRRSENNMTYQMEEYPKLDVHSDGNQHPCLRHKVRVRSDNVTPKFPHPFRGQFPRRVEINWGHRKSLSHTKYSSNKMGCE